MTPSRKANDFAHVNAPTDRMGTPSCSRHSGDTIQKIHVDQFLVLGRLRFRALAEAMRRFAASFQIQVIVAYQGRFAWGQYLRQPRERRPKPAVRIVGIPTHLSVMCFPKSRRERFGLKIQRLALLLRAAAASAWPNAISAVTANGQAMRSPPSSPKFSGVTPCGTSRSFPNGDRRPF